MRRFAQQKAGIIYSSPIKPSFLLLVQELRNREQRKQYEWARLFFDDLGLKKLVIGTGANLYPFNFKDENMNFAGYEIDLCHALAKYLSVEVEFQDFATIPDMISALKENKIDLIASSIIVTEVRKKLVNFSAPYFENRLGIAVIGQNETSNIDDLDLPGVTIGVSLGSTGDTASQKYFKKATIKSYRGHIPLEQAVFNQEVDAVIHDSAWLQHLKKQHGLRILDNNFHEPNLACIAVAKGNPVLLGVINTFIIQYIASDLQNQLYHKWFKEEVL